EHAPHEQRALRPPERPALNCAVGDPIEQAVEDEDRAAQKRPRARHQLALHAIDVRAVRDDENRLLAGPESSDVPVEEKLDLARVGGPRDQTERHPPTLARERSAL